MKTTWMSVVITVLIVLFSIDAVNAHGGGLNAQGCHNNRKTGDYHCHRPQNTNSSRSNKSTSSSLKSTDGRAYANCTEARAAGAAPVRKGDPGYGTHLDRDGDGIGCE